MDKLAGLREPIPVASLPEFTNANTVVILAMGQSNAASHGSPRGNAGSACFAFHEGQFYPGTDPWKGSSGFGGSVWSRLGQRVINSQLGDYVVVACVAQGSTCVSEWTPGTRCFQNTDRAIRLLHQKDLDIDWVIWHQGESDVIVDSASKFTYHSHLDNVIQGVRSCGVDAPFLVCLTSTFGSVKAPEIRLAQLAVCNAMKNVFSAADTDDLGADFRCDGVHFNDSGFSRFADRLFHSMMQVPTGSSAVSGEEEF